MVIFNTDHDQMIKKYIAIHAYWHPNIILMAKVLFNFIGLDLVNLDLVMPIP